MVVRSRVRRSSPIPPCNSRVASATAMQAATTPTNDAPTALPANSTTPHSSSCPFRSSKAGLLGTATETGDSIQALTSSLRWRPGSDASAVTRSWLLRSPVRCRPRTTIRHRMSAGASAGCPHPGVRRGTRPRLCIRSLRPPEPDGRRNRAVFDTPTRYKKEGLRPRFRRSEALSRTRWQVKDSNLRSSRGGFTDHERQARDQRKRPFHRQLTCAFPTDTRRQPTTTGHPDAA